MARLGLQSACPQCGAPLRFAGPSSLVSVCEFCRSAIAREGVDVHSLGKMPDLVTTDTRLALGCSGKIEQLGFAIVGRLQLQQGQAGWDEWYVTFSDGSYGWLAEAQGRVIVTRLYDQPVEIPRFEELGPGRIVELRGVGRVSIEEVGQGRFLSAQGELPFQPRFDRDYRFVDGNYAGQGWITIDYGGADDDARVFLGRALSYTDAGISWPALDREYRDKEVRGEALSCPSCGAPLALKPESKSVVCDSCHALCQRSEGKLALLAALQQRAKPALALGAKGELAGKKLEVIGWLQRSVLVGNIPYTWDEYLLHGEAGYRWLSENDGHWIFLRPLSGSSFASFDRGRRVSYQDRDYKHFQLSQGVRYLDMQGEFYWRIDPQDTVELDDYVSPPYLLSVETAKNEQHWTHGQAMSGEEVWKAFKQPGAPPAVSGTGTCQPNPYAERARSLSVRSAYALAILILLAAALAAILPRKTVLSFEVPLSSEQPVSISSPFEIEGSTHATEIAAQAQLGPSNTWIGLDVSLINDETGSSDSVQLEVSRFSGYDDGYWVEDNSKTRESIGSIPPGRYVLRVEPQVEPAENAPRVVRVDVSHGAFLWFPLVCALLAFSLPPIYFGLRSFGFETRRWAESDHPKFESSSSDDDD